jgi:hypothetical protein
MFYSNVQNFDVTTMHRNVYDLSHNFMFVSLLPKDLKKQFLDYLNQEAYEAYQYILNIDDQFLTQKDEAKFKILGPFSYYSFIEEQLEKYSDQLEKKEHQKFLFFYSTDDDRSLDLSKKFKLNSSDFFLYRTGGFRKKCEKNVFGIPYIMNDYFTGTYKDKHLSLSFCGKPDNNFFKEQIINQIKVLKYSDFIIRTHWANDSISSGCGLDPIGSYNLGPSKKSKKEYIDNIERNLYGLCLRGVSNASYRLYEVFMMGRIPVLIDTDCILPFKDQIPYQTNTVIIKNFDNIDQQIRNFHDSHTEEELLNIQKQNRDIWIKYFRVDGAYKETKKLLLKFCK